MLTLYYAVNTCSLATHIALEDARARLAIRYRRSTTGGGPRCTVLASRYDEAFLFPASVVLFYNQKKLTEM